MFVLHHINDATATVEETAQNAAREILTYDGFKYEIRNEDGEFVLYHSSRSENAGGGYKMNPTTISSFNKDRDAAEQEIFEEVVKRSTDFAYGNIEAYDRDAFIKMCDEMEWPELLEQIND